MENTPNLRFKEFSTNLENKKISSLFERIINKVDVIESEYYQQIGIRSHGKGIFYKEVVSGKELGNKRVFWIEPNVFIVNIVFAWEQAVARTTSNEAGMIASHRFPMYKPKNDILNLDYVVQMFKTSKGKFLLSLASPGGAGRNKTLGQKEFDNLYITIPSYKEQEKVASFFNLIDKKIEKQLEKVVLLKDYKKGVMQSIFSQKIRFKDNEGKNFPKWKDKSLKKLGETYVGLHGKTKDDFGKGNSNYIVYKNVFCNVLAKKNNVDLIYIEEEEKQNTVIKGDLLFTTSSETPNEVGMVSCWFHDIEGIYLNSFCFGYRLFEQKKYSPIFMAYLLRSEFYRKKISILAQGSTRYNISKNSLMKMIVSVPSIDEQIKIENFLLSLEIKIEKEEEKLELLNQYKKGLLQQMFV